MNEAPLPKVWVKISAAEVQPDGSWRWPPMQCRCHFMGFVTDDGQRISSAEASHILTLKRIVSLMTSHVA